MRARYHSRSSTTPLWAGRHPTCRPHSFKLTQRAEAGAKLFRQELRLLPSCKVPALREDIEMKEIVVRALRPGPRTLIDFFGKHAHRSRNGDAQFVEKTALKLGVQPSGGHAGVRQPGESDVVENVVPRKLAVRLPFDKEFRDMPVARHVVVDHPGGQREG